MSDSIPGSADSGSTAPRDGDRPTAGPLAEFSALRDELTARTTLQHQVFVLQLTSAGAVFSIALANPSRTPVVLVLPLTTYLFAGSYTTLHRVIMGIARYIEKVLGPKVPGGLGWEPWLRNQNSKTSTFNFIHPYLLAFPGTSLLAVAFGVTYALRSRNVSDAQCAAMLVAAFAGALVTVASSWLTYKLIRPIATDEDRDN